MRRSLSEFPLLGKTTRLNPSSASVFASASWVAATVEKAAIRLSFKRLLLKTLNQAKLLEFFPKSPLLSTCRPLHAATFEFDSNFLEYVWNFQFIKPYNLRNLFKKFGGYLVGFELWTHVGCSKMDVATAILCTLYEVEAIPILLHAFGYIWCDCRYLSAIEYVWRGMNRRQILLTLTRIFWVENLWILWPGSGLWILWPDLGEES